MRTPRINRRRFLQRTAMAAGLASSGLVAGAAPPQNQGAGEDKKRVALLRDPEDPVSAAPPAQWALGQLRDALANRGFAVSLRQRLEEVAPEENCVLAGGATASLPRDILGKPAKQ